METVDILYVILSEAKHLSLYVYLTGSSLLAGRYKKRGLRQINGLAKIRFFTMLRRTCKNHHYVRNIKISDTNRKDKSNF
jgi:hypothetical protein